jgi:hypothetical protein
VGVAAIYGKVGRTDSRQSSGRACEPGDGGDDVENDTRRTSNAIRDPTSSSKPIIPGELAARNEWMQLPVPATTASVTASSPAGRRQDQGKHEEPLPGQSTGTGHHGRRAQREKWEKWVDTTSVDTDLHIQPSTRMYKLVQSRPDDAFV